MSSGRQVPGVTSTHHSVCLETSAVPQAMVPCVWLTTGLGGYQMLKWQTDGLLMTLSTLYFLIVTDQQFPIFCKMEVRWGTPPLHEWVLGH